MNAMGNLPKTEPAVPADLPVPPGEYLAEIIGELGMTKNELATRMARAASKLSRIFKGKNPSPPTPRYSSRRWSAYRLRSGSGWNPGTASAWHSRRSRSNLSI